MLIPYIFVPLPIFILDISNLRDQQIGPDLGILIDLYPLLQETPSPINPLDASLHDNLASVWKLEFFQTNEDWRLSDHFSSAEYLLFLTNNNIIEISYGFYSDNSGLSLYRMIERFFSYLKAILIQSSLRTAPASAILLDISKECNRNKTRDDGFPRGAMANH